MSSLGCYRVCATVSVAAAIVSGAVRAEAQREQANPQRVLLRVQNPLPAARGDETIGVGWSRLQALLPDIARDRVRVRDIGSGREVASQVLDADLDGRPDTLLFQSSFLASEERTFAVEPKAPEHAYASRAHVKFVPERTDVAWENDRIAFRTYGQLLWQLENLHSSGVDVWVKRTREPVLDRWYSAGHDAYHADRGEGADFFKVGSTLGAGATAIWRDGRLYRAENFRTHRIIADGPIRAIFELEFDPWSVGGVRVTESKRISIDAGQHVYWQQSIFRSTDTDTVTYAIGFVKRPGLVGSTSRARPWAWLAGWGPVENKPGEGGHGDLGTVVLVDRGRVLDVKETDDHYVLVASAPSGQPVVHFLGAGWTGSRDFGTVEDWWRYVEQYVQRLESPLQVTLLPPASP